MNGTQTLLEPAGFIPDVEDEKPHRDFESAFYEQEVVRSNFCSREDHSMVMSAVAQKRRQREKLRRRRQR